MPLEDLYHSTMIPASSALHGDWSALDEYLLVRCTHPLHDAHAVPRAEYAPEPQEQFPELTEHIAVWAFEAYCVAMDHQPITDSDAEAEMHQAVDQGDA